MEARNRKLEEWFASIQGGYIALPRFQRFEAWAHQQVSSLLDTVLLELPAGAVLTLDVGDEQPFITRAVVGAPALSEKVNEYLLDGQQRLTALWRSLGNDYDDRTFFIRANDDGSFETIAQSRWPKNGKLFPVWASDPLQQWERNLIPADLLCPGSKGEKRYNEWVGQVCSTDPKDQIKLITIITKLRNLVAGFNIPFLSLPRTTPKDTALNVFIQMNTSSSPLTAYDIVVAQVEAGTGQSLHDLVDDIKLAAPNAENYLDPADWALAVGALLLNKTPTRAAYLEASYSNGLIENWERVKTGIRRATDFLAEQKIFDSQRLATDVVLYPLAALWSGIPDGLDDEGKARVILKKYLWRAFFTERYERTSATRALSDYREMSQLLGGNLTTIPLVFDDDQFPLPTEEEFKLAGWPKRRDRLPRAILALSLTGDAFDFADGSAVTKDNIKKREYHHLFPDAWLTKHEYSSRDIYITLNCALVTWKTNRNMAAKAPSVYLEERLDTDIDEQEIERRLSSHLIDHADMISDAYDVFIDNRAKAMHAAMIDICS